MNQCISMSVHGNGAMKEENSEEDGETWWKTTSLNTQRRTIEEVTIGT